MKMSLRDWRGAALAGLVICWTAGSLPAQVKVPEQDTTEMPAALPADTLMMGDSLLPPAVMTPRGRVKRPIVPPLG